MRINEKKNWKYQLNRLLNGFAVISGNKNARIKSYSVRNIVKSRRVLHRLPQRKQISFEFKDPIILNPLS